MGKMSLKVMKRLLLLTCAIILISSLRFNAPRRHTRDKSSIRLIQSKYNILEIFRKQYIVIIDRKVEETKIVEQKVINLGTFKVSAYNLSYQSTQKSRGSSGYGITSSGFNLSGHTLSSARVIATDPNVIPTGSIVELTFLDEKYKKYNGNYRAFDIGGAIVKNRIDLFIGDDYGSNKRAINFGITKAEVIILNN